MTGTLNHLKTFLLLGALSALVVGLGGAIGGSAMWIAAAFALLMNVGAWFFSDRMVLAMHRAEPLTAESAPQLHAMVAELAARADIPTPKLYRIPDPVPNAFATGRNPAHGVVAVTDGLLQVLPPREVRAVLAHEVAHIANRDILVSTIAAVFASVVSGIANMLQWSAILGGGDDDEESSPMASLALAFVAPIIAILVQMGISRTREYLADDLGAKLADDPEGLARALELLHGAATLAPTPAAAHPATASLFIVNPLTAGQKLASWFSTHPPMEERVKRLRGRRAA